MFKRRLGRSHLESARWAWVVGKSADPGIGWKQMAAKNRVVGESMSRDVPQMLAVCEEHDLASIDVRHRWELPTQRFQQLETIRRIFADAGDPRTLTQIALAWIWTRSDRTIPIPGFKTVAHVKENIQAMEFGPLSDEQMKTIDEIFERPPVI